MFRNFFIIIFCAFAVISDSSFASSKKLQVDYSAVIDEDQSITASKGNALEFLISLPMEIKLRTLSWFINVDSPETLVYTLSKLCDCALIDYNFARLLNNKNIIWCLKERLLDSGKSLLMVKNSLNQTVLHCVMSLSRINNRVLTILIKVAKRAITQLAVVQDLAGETFLHAAVRENCLYAVQKFLTNKFIKTHELVTKQDNYGWTAVHIAASWGHVKLLNSVFVTRGIKADELMLITDNNGRIALHIACEAGNEDIATFLLLESGVKISQLQTILDIDGENFLSLARKNRHTNLEKILQIITE